MKNASLGVVAVVEVVTGVGLVVGCRGLLFGCCLGWSSMVWRGRWLGWRGLR